MIKLSLTSPLVIGKRIFGIVMILMNLVLLDMVVMVVMVAMDILIFLSIKRKRKIRKSIPELFDLNVKVVIKN